MRNAHAYNQFNVQENYISTHEFIPGH